LIGTYSPLSPLFGKIIIISMLYYCKKNFTVSSVKLIHRKFQFPNEKFFMQLPFELESTTFYEPFCTKRKKRLWNWQFLKSKIFLFIIFIGFPPSSSSITWAERYIITVHTQSKIN
jgi:hypothetical protein